MSPDTALRLVGLLTMATNGWTDDSVELYTRKLASLTNADAAASAISQVIDSWQLASRPPWGAIQAAYERTAQRLTRPEHAIEDHASIGPAEGWLIAKNAYVAEMTRQGRAPDPDRLATFDAASTRALNPLLGFQTMT